MYESYLNLITERYSVRNFSDKVIDNDSINKILEAGHLAPTACNLQPQRILVINDDEGISKLKKCTKCHFDANTAILICYDKNECWKRQYDGKTSGDIDASIVTTHMMLAASALGIGTTWVMHFIPEALKVEFAIPDNMEPVALLVMGYPAQDAKPAKLHLEFKALDEIVSYNKF